MYQENLITAIEKECPEHYRLRTALTFRPPIMIEGKQYQQLTICTTADHQDQTSHTIVIDKKTGGIPSFDHKDSLEAAIRNHYKTFETLQVLQSIAPELAFGD